jgi:hypothetical protein
VRQVPASSTLAAVSSTRIAVIGFVVAIVLALAGAYEWSQTVTCGQGASSRCKAGSRRHPRRAEALWVAAAVVALGSGGLMYADRRRA